MNRFPSALFALMAVAVIAISMTGCGYRGPLYLPGEEADSADIEAAAESEDPEEKESKD